MGDVYTERYPKSNIQSGRSQRLEVIERVRAPRRLSVVESCQKYMRISTPGGFEGAWSAEIAPYMCEPMNACVSRAYESVIFVGVAQSGKTASLAEGLITYSIVVDPSDCTLIMPSQDSARDFSKRRVERLIRSSPEIKKRMSIGQDDNILDKRTTAGALITIGWPTVSQLASKNLKRVILSDLDRMPADIGNEGDGFGMARKRTQSFMSAGKVVAESTPGFEVTDKDWKPPSPDSHEAPPVAGGVLSLYNAGTRERFYWTCPHCSELFRAEMQHFRWDDLDDPLEAAKTAHMVCPECGSVIHEHSKSELNLKGVWLAEGWRTGNPRKSKSRSFWMHGVAAAFQRWSSLALNMILARKDFEDTGNLEKLRVTTNVDWGLPFSQPSASSERTLSALLAQAEPFETGILPDDTRFLMATVDMQKTRFVVQIQAFGAARERWVIDRFNLTKSKRIGEDGSLLPIRPFENSEDFEVLSDMLTTKTYKYRDGAELGLRLMVMDSGGLDEATANAYRFWQRCAKLGIAEKVMLVKGDGSTRAKRINRSVSQKVSGVPLWTLNANMFKSEVWHDISRVGDGPGKLHLSSTMPDWFFQELLAETQDPVTGRWTKVSAKARNESLDLACYATAGYAALGCEVLDWSNEDALPIWARRHELGDIIDADEVDSAAKEVAAAPKSGGVDWAKMGAAMNN